MKERKRLGEKVRRDEILTAALRLARKKGYQNIERAAVAKAAFCSDALISSYFGTMPQLKKAVMRAAVARKDLTVIAQGLSVKDRHALKAPPEVRHAAAQSLAGA